MRYMRMRKSEKEPIKYFKKTKNLQKTKFRWSERKDKPLKLTSVIKDNPTCFFFFFISAIYAKYSFTDFNFSFLVKLFHLSFVKLGVAHCFSMTQRWEELSVCVCAMLLVCASARWSALYAQHDCDRSRLLITMPTLPDMCPCQMVPVALSLKHHWCW